MLINPWLGITIVVSSLLVLFAALRFYQHRFSPHPELVRKLLHIIMGGVTLSFPWLFHESWPVLLLASVTILSLLLLRRVKKLKKQWGDVIHGISRNSSGEIYFPAAVAILFVLAKGDALLFCIPVLILSLADALAALVGVYYGKYHYATSEGSKSFEGSLAFFTIAFLSVHIPLLLFSDVGRSETLLIGLIMGVLVMLFEAIAWQGLDNLFIPLGAFVLLKTYIPMDSESLFIRLVVICLLVVLFYVARRRTTLDDSAMLGAALVAYVSWAIGGVSWLLPPLIMLIAYSLFNAHSTLKEQPAHTIYAVVSVSLPGLIWLFFAKSLQQPDFIYPYTVAYAAQLAIIGVARIKCVESDITDRALLTRTTLQSWGLLIIPFMVLYTNGWSIVLLAASALCLIPLAAFIFLRWQPNISNCPTDSPRWWRQTSVATLVSLLSLTPLYLSKGL